MKIKKHREKSRLIVYHGDKLLVLQKKTKKIKYGFIGGYLKKEESPEEAIIRETYEETLVLLSKQNIDYQYSITLELKNKNKLSKHYFVSRNYDFPYIVAEPQKFKKIKWVSWKRSLKFLSKSDRKVVKTLFKSCKLELQ